MKQLANAVSFKSTPGMWEAEHDGRKPNTIRMMTSDEWDWMLHETPAEVFIVNTGDGKVFVREITHVLKVFEVLGQVQVLVSWQHEGRVSSIDYKRKADRV